VSCSTKGLCDAERARPVSDRLASFLFSWVNKWRTKRMTTLRSLLLITCWGWTWPFKCRRRFWICLKTKDDTYGWKRYIRRAGIVVLDRPARVIGEQCMGRDACTLANRLAGIRPARYLLLTSWGRLGVLGAYASVRRSRIVSRARKKYHVGFTRNSINVTCL